MCGICGFIDLNGTVDLSAVKRMTAAMVHRGPDSDGFFGFGNVSLGMRRLAIIDIHGGDQPVYNEDRTVAVVQNGEIYNFRELVAELQKLGHRFVSRTDTEVIVHAYEEWGSDCVNHLRGIFAFALCDTRCGGCPLVLIARDRFGVKPLYYYHDGQRFLFASEVRALLASKLVPGVLGVTGLRSFLAYGSLQEPLTLIDNVYSLLPAHCLTIKNNTVAISRYWSLPVNTGETGTGQVHEKMGCLLEESVRTELVSDVPLGVFLSGGIDSGVIASLAAKAGPVRTFNISFTEKDFDESVLAETTAKKCGSRHERIVVKAEDMLRDLPNAIASMDQPTVDGINTWYVAQATKRAGVTVALSGLGGDELFAGYRLFRHLPKILALSRRLDHVPGMVRRSAAAFVRRLIGSNAAKGKFAMLIGGKIPFGHPYFASRLWFNPGEQANLINGPHENDDAARQWEAWVDDCKKRAGTYDTIGQISYFELTQYMLSRLLRDADCMSMAHSLEVRVPFLDHVLAEAVIGVPGTMKLSKTVPKPLMIKSVGSLLPSEIVSSPKRTFTFPWEAWLRGALRSEIESSLGSLHPILAAHLKSEGVAAVWKAFLAGRTTWSRPWGLYILNRWCEKNL
ncbi:MAG: asparagine synthase (glutamine-hydrolyzing) [Chitinispirillaceae bacterium]|nr:asparagine synthase (glutamine-hydrolyzing) [Chitinispirillaceae bacterium]